MHPDHSSELLGWKTLSYTLLVISLLELLWPKLNAALYWERPTYTEQDLHLGGTLTMTQDHRNLNSAVRPVPETGQVHS